MTGSNTTGIAPGTVIGGRYTVESLLGRGGMASVYRATDVPLGRSVALKVFTVDTEGAAGLGRESSEIQLLASLNHHALVTLFDATIDGGDHSYLVMELVEGPTLKERIDQGAIAEIDVAQMVVDLGEALHVVHGNGVVHRDVKPANILLNPSALQAIEFRAKLSDFGIAHLIDSTRLTMPGTIIGTAAYLSPEQARGAAPGAPADVYSLGLVALEALTGVRAFEGTMVESISARLVNDPPIPATVGPAWTALISRMTDRRPEARPTALEVVELARSIERDVYAAAAGVPAATLPLDGDVTQPVEGVTQPLADARPVEEPTRVLPAASDDATSVLPATTDGEATTVLPAASASPAASTPSRSPIARRIVLAVAAALVVITAAAFAWGAVSGGGEAEPTPTPTPLPANDGMLGTHLDELLESVTP